MRDWWRYIPHPIYGYYGGAYNIIGWLFKLAPKDWMDWAFLWHDILLGEKVDCADEWLLEQLKTGDVSKLGWYGKVYRKMAIIIFTHILREKYGNTTEWNESKKDFF